MNLILNFTGDNVSTLLTRPNAWNWNEAYFPKYEKIYRLASRAQPYINGSLSVDDGAYVDSYSDLNKLFYGFKTVDGSQTLASYFNTQSLIKESRLWNFSSAPDFIDLRGFGLNGRDVGGDIHQGFYSFKNDSFNLGAGSDNFRLEIDTYIWPDPYPTDAYKNLMDYIIDGSYEININGDDGNDSIDVSFGPNDFTVDAFIGGEWTSYPSIPIAKVSGGAGADYIYVDRMAAVIDGGAGPDTIFNDYCSDRIYGGNGDDWISGIFSLSSYDSPVQRKQTLNQRDIITGGSGRDTIDLGGITLNYQVNGSNDFAVITDFRSGEDQLQIGLSSGRAIIDMKDGIEKLPQSASYPSSSYKYTASIYIDMNDDGVLQRGIDELVARICGDQPGKSDINWGITSGIYV